MRTLTRLSAVAIAALPLLSAPPEIPLYQKFLSPASPQELTSAKKVDRIAWVDYAEGKRNAYAASAPLFTPVRLTNFTKDDGIMMSEVKISDDGSTVIFLRGEQLNRDGWAPNPSADPNGPEHAFWAAHTNTAGVAWRVVDCTNPELAPDGSSLLFVKNGQIYRAKISSTKPATEVDRGEKPFISEWGVQSNPKFSPDGRKIAWVSTRSDHSFIMVYDIATKAVKYMSPSVDFDTMPLWQSDSQHLIFERQPGLPFGQGPLTQQTAAATPAAAAGAGTGRGGGRGGRGGGAAAAPAAATPAATNTSAGLMRATFKGGYTLSFYKADVNSGEAQETWHNQPTDPLAANIAQAHLAGDLVVYQLAVAGGRGGGGGRGARGGRAGADTPPAPRGTGGCACSTNRRMGTLLLPRRPQRLRASGAPHPHQRHDRRPNLDQFLG